MLELLRSDIERLKLSDTMRLEKLKDHVTSTEFHNEKIKIERVQESVAEFTSKVTVSLSLL